MNDIKKIYEKRLKNLVHRRGDESIFNLQIEIIESLESEFNITMNEKLIQEIEEITENYVDLF
jgi:hypothetical protein